MKKFFQVVLFLAVSTFMNAQVEAVVSIVYDDAAGESTVTVSFENSGASAEVLNNSNIEFSYDIASAEFVSESAIYSGAAVILNNSIPGTISWGYLNFGSNLTIPAGGSVDLFSFVLARASGSSDMGDLTPEGYPQSLIALVSGGGGDTPLLFSGDTDLEPVVLSLWENDNHFEVIEEEFDIAIYPSPFSESITVEYDDVSAVELSVMTIDGTVVLTETIVGGGVDIVLEDLPSGVYVVTMNSSQFSYAKKIVKQ